MKDTITIRLPVKISKELKKYCKEAQVPLSDVVRESLHKYLAVKKFRQLRDKVLPYAEAAGLLTDDDVFKVMS